MDNKLPALPSALLRLAVADVALCEADPKYMIRMSVWHSYSRVTEVCHVCFGGAVLAKTVEFPIMAFFDAVETIPMSKHDINCIMALDSFRNGEMTDGVEIMGFDASHIDETFWIFDRNHEDGVRETVRYHEDPAQFKADMLAMADHLEGKGL